MTQTIKDPSEVRRWRGLVLELIYTAFQNRQSAYSYDRLWSVMLKLGHSVGLNDVVFVCRWLRDSGFLKYEETRDRWSNKVSADNIRITPAGCSLVEGTKENDDVQVLI